jgi:hypothetical protein
MIDLFRAQRGKLALLLGGLVLGYAAGALKRVDAMDFDSWAVD